MVLGAVPEAGFRIFAFSPPKVFDADLAVAACRAGAIGVLNAEYVSAAGDVESALLRLAANAVAVSPTACYLVLGT